MNSSQMNEACEDSSFEDLTFELDPKARISLLSYDYEPFEVITD